MTKTELNKKKSPASLPPPKHPLRRHQPGAELPDFRRLFGCVAARDSEDSLESAAADYIWDVSSYSVCDLGSTRVEDGGQDGGQC